MYSAVSLLSALRPFTPTLSHSLIEFLILCMYVYQWWWTLSCYTLHYRYCVLLLKERERERGQHRGGSPPSPPTLLNARASFPKSIVCVGIGIWLKNHRYERVHIHVCLFGVMKAKVPTLHWLKLQSIRKILTTLEHCNGWGTYTLNILIIIRMGQWILLL